MKIPKLLEELERARKKWLEAKKKGDKVMMGLWEKYGCFLKKNLEEEERLEKIYQEAKEVFDEKE